MLWRPCAPGKNAEDADLSGRNSPLSPPRALLALPGAFPGLSSEPLPFPLAGMSEKERPPSWTPGWGTCQGPSQASFLEDDMCQHLGPASCPSVAFLPLTPPPTKRSLVAVGDGGIADKLAVGWGGDESA